MRDRIQTRINDTSRTSAMALIGVRPFSFAFTATAEWALPKTVESDLLCSGKALKVDGRSTPFDAVTLKGVAIGRFGDMTFREFRAQLVKFGSMI